MYQGYGLRRNGFNENADSVTSVTRRHHMVHDGYCFTISGTFLLNATTTIYLGTITGNMYSHITLPLVTQNKEDFDIIAYEGGSYTTGGAIPNTIINNNRASSNLPSAVETYLGVTPVAMGTKIFEDYIAGMEGLAGQVGGGSNQESEEFILNKNTVYILEMKNNSDEQAKVNLRLQWYETEFLH